MRLSSATTPWPWLERDGTCLTLDPTSMCGDAESTLQTILCHLNDDSSELRHTVTNVYLSMDIFRATRPMDNGEDHPDARHVNVDDTNHGVDATTEGIHQGLLEVSTPPFLDPLDQPHAPPLPHVGLTEWRAQLLRALSRSLPNLQSLRFYSSGGNKITSGVADTEIRHEMTVEELADVVTHAPRLHTLITTRCLAALRDRHDVSILASALVRHPALTQIKLLDISMVSSVSPAGRSWPTLDPLVRALSTIRQLESIDITLNTILQALPAFEKTAATTAPNMTLRSLLLHSLPAPKRTHDTVVSPAALHALLTQCVALTDVSLWGCRLQDAHLVALGNALPAHRTLQFLSLRRNASITDQAWCTFYQSVLPYCYSLQALYNDHSALDGLMESSTPHRHGVSPDARHSDAVAAGALYLSLNRLGRGALMQDERDNREAWLDMIQNLTDAPSAIFALISQHPMALVGSSPAVTSGMPVSVAGTNADATSLL